MYDEKQQKQINLAKENGIDLTLYATEDKSATEMYFIRTALESNKQDMAERAKTLRNKIS